MTRKSTENPRLTGRRGFFRELLIQAIEGVEKAGKQFAEQRFGHFKQPYTPPAPPPSYERYLSKQYTTYGPPWPPPFGPHVSIELRHRLNASRPTPPLGGPVPQN